ncbi:Na(+)-translocating NADH-quinone reductase subunit A [Draconibacterium halophilum]|uniref:Na(+)-translocating NADH-quinone reductase subunit A n=1 Tax=Draconibacterium halophilum TaxID=2706887 RepID=A0A6C0RES2_9BACT|nr:Na(+)-translocating NADH-quinone reductase subunit A [Draconibacterium halophilum]QIA08567.1 Na(+)-translocating NADH-quinone reductase subunit A [Draconibacterium halophilum]
MSEVIKLRKGLNIKLKGSAEKALDKLPVPATVALKPTDFTGLTPKLSVKVDAEVKAGEALFYDKYHPEILFTAPLGGKVVSINRGERRKILEVVISTDEKIGSAEFKKADPTGLSAEVVKEQILKSGLWPFIKKRPYGIIANPEEKPKAIYISTFDSAPLAPDYSFVLDGQMDTFQTGINALAQLTEGKVNLGVSNGSAFSSVKNVEVNAFEGPHPAGNVGIQIANTSPLNKGEVVWTINVQDVLFIGRLFETGKVDFTKTVALTGSEVKTPKYYQTTLGAPVATLVEGKLIDADYNQRIISGNVLTGSKVSAKGFLGYYDAHMSVIPEGDEYEFLGWADPGFNKFSATKAYFGKLFPKKEYTMNANIHGGERAFVLSNQYEKLVPMDIFPVFLLKAILVNDIDKMENLGIYEVIEEDFALCEYACTSKIEVQKILREGINTMIKELG